MVSNPDNIIRDLREQFAVEGLSPVSDNIEKCLLEFKTELYMKRDEAKQILTDLELANNEINELKRELDTLNKQCEETQFSWNILMKKSKTIQDALSEKRDNLQKVQIQYTMAAGELDVLKDKFRKLNTEKNDLLRKIEFFETKQKHTSAYDSEIFKRETLMKDAVKDINCSLGNLKLEQQNVIKMTKNSHSMVESMRKLKSIQTNFDDLKKDKDNVEELYEQVKAKHDKLKEYMSTSNPSLHNTNLISKLILSQWKQDQISYEKGLKETNQELAYLCEEYEKARIGNINMILENEQLRGYNQDLIRLNETLKSKLNDHKETCKKETVIENIPIPDDDEVIIKDEIIEISDD